MKVIGYCYRCHKIKSVNVTIPRGRGVQIGLCQQCEDKSRG
jgi:hypothetical protein